MSQNHKHTISALESLKNSLRWCIRAQTDGVSETTVRTKAWTCSATLDELAYLPKLPVLFPMLMDFEFRPPDLTRIWFEVEFAFIDEEETTAYFRACADNF